MAFIKLKSEVIFQYLVDLIGTEVDEKIEAEKVEKNINLMYFHSCYSECIIDIIKAFIRRAKIIQFDVILSKLWPVSSEKLPLVDDSSNRT